jgi:hypothetical protein
LIDGLQVPVMPLLEVVGKAVMEPPEQIGVTAVNVGKIRGVTVTCCVEVLEQPPLV